MTSGTAKESIINKALNRGNQRLSEIALANNIALSTLGRWLRENKSIKQLFFCNFDLTSCVSD